MKILSLILSKSDSLYDISISGLINVDYDESRNDMNFYLYKRDNIIDNIGLKMYSMIGNHFYVGTKSNQQIREMIKEWVIGYVRDEFEGCYFNQTDLDIIDKIDFQSLIKK